LPSLPWQEAQLDWYSNLPTPALSTAKVAEEIPDKASIAATAIDILGFISTSHQVG
jgi:hypothetical protein